MMRRFILVGVFVVVQPGTIEQLAYGAFIALLYLAIQLTAKPFKSLADDFIAAISSLALSMLFLICLLYKYGALTQLEDVQEVMSLELRSDYVVAYVSLSGILLFTCLSTFIALGAIVAKLSADEAVARLTVRRLVFIESEEKVQASALEQKHMHGAKKLEEMLCGPDLYKTWTRLYKKESSPLPSAGPFHIFLSHSERPDSIATAYLSEPYSIVSSWAQQTISTPPQQIGSTDKLRCASLRGLSVNSYLGCPSFWSALTILESGSICLVRSLLE